MMDGSFGVFQAGEKFFRHIPLFEYFENDRGGEAGADKLPHDAAGFFVGGRLFEAFAGEVLAGQRFFADVFVSGVERFRGELGVNAFLQQVLLDATPAVVLIFLAQAGEGGGES